MTPSHTKAKGKAKANQAGQDAETWAKTYLTAQGLTWINSNYRCPHGEIDLIMLASDKREKLLVFVEVRLRNSDRFGGAMASITPSKQQRIGRTAQHFLQHHPQYQSLPCRFDAVCLSAGSSNTATAVNTTSVTTETRNQVDYSVEWVQNAFHC